MPHSLKKISFMPKAAQVHRMLLFLNLGGRWVPQSNSFPRMVPDQGHQKHPGRQILKMQTLWPVLGLSRSVMSNSLQPQELQPIRLLCPWYSPRNSTGVGCHSLLQGIFPTQELNLCLLHCRWILYCLSHHRSPLWPQSWPAGSRTVQSGRDQWVCVITSLAGDAHQAWTGWTLHSWVWDPQRAHYLHEIWRQPATSILRVSAAPCPRKLDHQEESRMPWGKWGTEEGEMCLHCKWRVQNRRFAHLHHAWGSRAQKV